MSLIEVLLNAGFTEEQAKTLSKNKSFIRNFQYKDSEFIQNHIHQISKKYKINQEQTRSIIVKFHPFVSLDHTRVFNDLRRVFKISNLSIRSLILRHPPFAGYNYDRILNSIQNAFGCTKKQAILSIFRHPQFAGLNHERVMRNLSKFGRIAGISKKEIKYKVLANPPIAGCSKKRYLAALDIGRVLRKEGYKDSELLPAFKVNFGKSPYIPGTRLRISKYEGQNKNISENIPLFNAMRETMDKKRKSIRKITS